MTLYIGIDQLEPIFAYIAEKYGNEEEVPEYAFEQSGMEKLLGILKGVQADTYYPEILDKATYLLTQINKGHFFSNGNKRLALVVTSAFLTLNGLRLSDMDKSAYRTFLSKLFPDYKSWDDFAEFTPSDFGMYHLSIVIADSGAYDISYEDLKFKVRLFLQEIVVSTV